MGSCVTMTLHDDDADRCVKIVNDPNGTFGFKEFRREPEDAGAWTIVSDAQAAYATEAQAVAAARTSVAWLRDVSTPAKETP
jgi:hypothetical protein